MKLWWLFGSFNLWLLIGFDIVAIQPRLAEEKSSNFPAANLKTRHTTSVPTLTQYPVTQTPAVPLPGEEQGGLIVPIIGVIANSTDKGVEVILQTTQGKILQPVTLAFLEKS